MMYEPSSKMKIYASPMRYYQGPGILGEVSGRIFKNLGGSLFVFGGRRALGALESHGFYRSIRAQDLTYVIEEFGGECCDAELEKLSKTALDCSCSVVVGAGGGKALDSAKAVGSRLGLPVVCVPTIASTDAPTSSLSVMYDERHEFVEYRFYDHAPMIVLVDTEVIAEAPVRYLACGIGDAFSKKWEVEACYSSGGINQIVKPVEGYSPLVGLCLADATDRILRRYSREAFLSVSARKASPAVEAVVEACILLSGLSFESGGLAAAHSVSNGLTLIEDQMKPRQYHGELVFFGTCVQLVLEDRPRSSVNEAFSFGHQVGLPMNLSDLGLSNISSEDLWRISEKTVAEGETIHKMPFKVTAEAVYNAIRAADAIGRAFARTATARATILPPES
ncbi:glycerol dehydrogenase [Candidatus Bathyarchaeota archaeon]|nr:glycerol dehydrogenase [Candidatus Bathyarchaeota archaeon]